MSKYLIIMEIFMAYVKLEIINSIYEMNRCKGKVVKL